MKKLFLLIIFFTTMNLGVFSQNTLKVSLAEWSFHRALSNGTMTNLDFPVIAKTRFNIDAVEYVNSFFKDKAEDMEYLTKLKNICKKYGVKSLLIMIDGEGDLGDTSASVRTKAIENHYKWIKAAKFLGCHSIRVNARGTGSREEVAKAATDALHRLCEYAKPYHINVIVENHGGYSSDGKWLSGVIRNVNMPNCGTLPDFGNFYEYDRYQGVKDMMPFAKGVSGKSYDFDDQGNETKIDFYKMIKIVKDSGFKGYVDAEYEGNRLSEDEGVRATKALLEKTFAEVK